MVSAGSVPGRKVTFTVVPGSRQSRKLSILVAPVGVTSIDQFDAALWIVSIDVACHVPDQRWCSACHIHALCRPCGTGLRWAEAWRFRLGCDGLPTPHYLPIATCAKKLCQSGAFPPFSTSAFTRSAGYSASSVLACAAAAASRSSPHATGSPRRHSAR